MRRVFLSIILFTVIAFAATAQSALKLPSLSPNAKVTQDFSLSSIEISYSRPSMRGRKIMGDIIPYGHVWRTGANAATKLKIGEELEIAGRKVKAGEYALYTIPGRDNWEVVISSATGNWSAEGFPKEFDIARFKVKPMTMNDAVQTFTIAINDITFTTCKIELMWEHTKISIPVVARNTTTVDDNIDKAINNPPAVPYFQAASYYFETNQKIDIASRYVDKALEANPKAFYMWYLKARIEKKLGHVEEALAAARKSIELAQGTPNELEYKRNNDKLITELNKMKRYNQPQD
jgi:tetratricopeptide (TPR) repeat protein